MTHDSRNVDESYEAVYDVEDIVAVELAGDQLEGFLNNLENALVGLMKTPDEGRLRPV